jgi:uncharacterized tellurite resistance protein B-like protein
MGLSHLTDDELVTLAGLMREVIQADHEYTEAEKLRVDELAAELGEERFARVFEEAKRTLTSRHEVKEHAKTVTRSEARREIFDFLMKLAAADGVAREEERPLRWLASWWELGT